MQVMTTAKRIKIDDLKKEINVTDSQLDQKCSNEHLKDVARDVKNYTEFATEFEIPKGDLAEIEHDPNMTFTLKTEKVFLLWNQNYANTSYKKFVEICIKLFKGDIAKKMCKLCATLLPAGKP